MKHSPLRSGLLSLTILFGLLFISISSVNAVDGKKWDGKAYPFKLLDPSGTNSESNPFIIDTAGKLKYLCKVAEEGDLVGFGKEKGLNGLNHAFKDNYVKITADLDMNGALYEFTPIYGSFLNVDGGGHVITNLRISDKKTVPVVDDDAGTAEIYLALFGSAEQIKNLGVGKGSTITYNGMGYNYKGHLYMVSVYAAAIATDVNVMEGCFSDATITVKGKFEAKVGGVALICKYKMINSYFRGNINIDGRSINAVAWNKRKKDEPGNLRVGGVCAEPGTYYDPSLFDGGIFGCYNTGNITVNASGNEIQIGGVAGITTYRTICIDLYNTGKVSVSSTGDIKTALIGGVLGTGSTCHGSQFRPIKFIDAGKIYNTGNIIVTLTTGKRISVGGIGGGSDKDEPPFNLSSFRFSGIYGYLNTSNSGSISVTSTGKVDELNVGGIAGFGCIVFNSYNTGNISCDSGTGTTLNAGGIGGSGVFAQNCYNIGALTSKGTGTNVVGGVIGNAFVSWGEDEKSKSTVKNVYWLRQSQAGGINSDIAYGKGSYYYRPDEGELSSTDALISIFKKIKKKGTAEPAPAPKSTSTSGKMKEDGHRGAIYSFESPTTTVFPFSDDGPGNRKAYQGTLLQALNEMAQQFPDRKLHLWKIDESNGGYPVLE
jgi:hypothetical protein